MRAIDLTGQRYGRLRVTRRGPNTSGGATTWYTICDCKPGFERRVPVAGSSLRSGRARSCGCRASERKSARLKRQPLNPRKDTSREAQEIHRLRTQGWTMPQIAALFQVDRTTLYNWLRKEQHS